MEEPHVSGLHEQPTTASFDVDHRIGQKGFGGNDQIMNGRDDTIEPKIERETAENGEEAKANLKYVLNKTEKNTREENIDSDEYEAVKEKTYSCVIRSKTTAEEHSGTLGTNDNLQKSKKPLKLVVRTRSTEETFDHNPKELTADNTSIDIKAGSATQVSQETIAVQAKEIVEAVLEKLENPQEVRSDTQNEETLCDEEERPTLERTNVHLVSSRVESNAQSEQKHFITVQKTKIIQLDDNLTNIESNEETLQEEQTVTAEASTVELQAAADKSKVNEQEKEDTAEVVAVKFESNEEKLQEEHTVIVEASTVELPAAADESKLNEQEKEDTAEVLAVKFESNAEKLQEEHTVTVEASTVELPAAADESKVNEQEKEDTAEVLAVKFESNEEKLQEEHTVTVEASTVELPAAADESKVNEQEKEDTAEVLAVKFESNEEKLQEEQRVTVEASTFELPAAADESKVNEQEKEDTGEVLAVKFQSNEEKLQEEQMVTVEASLDELPASFVKNEENETNKKETFAVNFDDIENKEIREKEAEFEFETNSVPAIFEKEVDFSSAIEKKEESSSLKQEYVAEHVCHNSQSLYEVQDESEDKSGEVEEKAIITVTLAEEPYRAVSNDIPREVDNQELEFPSEIPLEPVGNNHSVADSLDIEDYEESDSDGEIEVTIERLSQENEQLIIDEESDEEGSPVDWMAKDDTDEVVFMGEPALSMESNISYNDLDINNQTNEDVVIQNKMDASVREIIVADTKEKTVCSDLGTLFPSIKETEMHHQFTKPKDEPAHEYDLERDVEVETMRLVNKNKIVSHDNTQVVVEEVLPDQKKTKDVHSLNVMVVDDDDEQLIVDLDTAAASSQEKDEEEKPPSPVEAKKVTEKGITEIFETEELRRSGIFEDTLKEEEEDIAEKKSDISKREVVLVNEEYLEAEEKRKSTSIEWSLLDKWDEMNKRQSLEVKGPASKANDTPLCTNDTNHIPHASAYQECGTDKMDKTTAKESTPSSTTSTKTDQTVTTTRIIKSRTEVQSLTQDEQDSSEDISLECDITPETHHTPHDTSEDTSSSIPEIEPTTTDEEHFQRPNNSTQDACMSTILFRMDGTPIIIPPTPHEPQTQPKEEQKAEIEPVEASPMSTILFKMDGTPFVVPAAKERQVKQQPSPKPKTVNFQGVRPQSINSVESVRGDREGEPPLAGEEESDIDDSCLHLAKHPQHGSSRQPTISPVKEVAGSPSNWTSNDEDKKDNKGVETPLLDQSSTDKGQKCCIIL